MAERVMKNRLIAAVMLASLACWSVPGAFASATTSRTAARIAQNSSSNRPGHSCCPEVHSKFVPPMFAAFTPLEPPCGDRHPCCARRGPENPAAIPATTRIERSDSQIGTWIATDSESCMRTVSAPLGVDSDAILSQARRSTVLRI